MYVWECKYYTHTSALWGVATRRYGINFNVINIDFIYLIFYKTHTLA